VHSVGVLYSISVYLFAYSFIGGLFNDAVSKSGHSALNGRITSKFKSGLHRSRKPDEDFIFVDRQ
jgi:hypothetical protein